MNKTGIEYLDFTWNPLIMNCTPVSEGCVHCWARQRAKMLSMNPKISDLERKAYCGLVAPKLIKDRLNDPLKRKKPARIGVQFMGDLFHEDVTNEMIDAVFRVMAHDVCYPLNKLNPPPAHTYLLLTKRPERILSGHPEFFARWPNIWLGISAENQQTADERIPILLQIPAAKRFVSIEPMLGLVDLKINNWIESPDFTLPPTNYFPEYEGIDWIIIGGLSLPGGKIQAPDPKWIDNIVEQCDEAGVPLFIKPNAKYPTKREEFPV